MKRIPILWGIPLALAFILVCVISCSVGTSLQQTVSGNPVEHQMGKGVVCYTYETGLSCLVLP